MAYLKRPQKGDRVLQSLFDSVNSIIDYLPTITVRGDNYSTYVEHSNGGTVIHAKQPYDTDQTGKGGTYYPGSGISIGSGNIINAKLSAGPNIKINYHSGYLVISGTPEGSGGGGGGGIEYHDGRYITISGDNTINCTLSALSELYNQPIISDQRPLSSEIESTYVYPNHFMQFKDWIGNKGQNTIITSGSFINTHTGAGDPGSWEYIFQYTGPQVDCLLTGGRFIDVHSHWQDSGGETPQQQEPDDHTINSLLSGDNQHIFIKELTGVNEINANGSWGGIISTNIHGDETTIHMAADGTLSCIGGSPTPGPGGGGCPWPNYNNLGEESNTLVYPLMRYTTSTGGWLRISCRGGTSRCVGVWIGDNYYGLGKGEAMTWSLAIPPASSFYVDVDWNLNNFIWFDSTVTPGTITIQQHDYWFSPPQWDPNKETISNARDVFFNAKYEETCCYNCMTGATVDIRWMSSDWTKLTMISGSDPDAEPGSRQSYENSIISMQKYLSGEYEGDTDERHNCEYHWDEAITISQQLNTLNNSLPSANPMYAYQVTNIPARCQQYYGKIEQYITSGQYYYDLVDQWWTQHDQQNQ